MVVHTAHVYIASDKKDAYFEMSYDNEMSPEFIRRDDFIEEFEDKNNCEDNTATDCEWAFSTELKNRHVRKYYF